jgi:N-acetylglutamate synthase-like GNAT family acetyltransferase
MQSYFDFTQKVFNFDLIDWKNAGYWDNTYVPHSLVYNDRIIANISVSIMQLQIMGRETFAIQLGSVGVLPEYRGNGFSCLLMEKVLEEYSQFPLIFLFANDSVLDFYPKFGFRRINEIIPLIYISDCKVQIREATKINLESECLRQLLHAELQQSSIIDTRRNQSVYWFHLIYHYSDNLYYIKDKDIVLIVKYQGDCAVIIDVLTTSSIKFDEIIGYILKSATNKVFFHFTPDWLTSDYEVVSNKGDTMYVLGDFPRSIPNFKFPVTAHT